MQKLLQASLRKWAVAFGGMGIMLPLYLLLACCFGMAAVIVTAKAPVRISAGLLDNCRGPYSKELAEAVAASGDIEAIPVSSLEQGEDLLLRGRAEVLLIISPDYDAEILEDSSEKLITIRTAPGAVSANLLRETIAGILTARRNAARMRLELEEDGIDSSLLEPYSRELELRPLVESVTADSKADGTGALFGTAYACYEGIAALALLLLLLTISRRLRDEAAVQVAYRLAAVRSGRDLAFFSDAGALLLAGFLCALLAFGIGPQKNAGFLAGLFCYTVCTAGLVLLLSSFEAAGRIDLLAPFLALTTSILGGCFVDLTMVSDTFRTISWMTPQGQLIAAVRGRPVFFLVLLLEGIVFGGAARLKAGNIGRTTGGK